MDNTKKITEKLRAKDYKDKVREYLGMFSIVQLIICYISNDYNILTSKLKYQTLSMIIIFE